MPCRFLGCVSQHTLQVSRPTPRGELEGLGGGGVPGPHLRGYPGPHPGGVSQHALRQTPPPHTQRTATAAGGTHSTGMHSCCGIVLDSIISLNEQHCRATGSSLSSRTGATTP